MLRFYINICKWRTYKLIYDHGEDWKLFIAIELVQTIFLGLFQSLKFKHLFRKKNAETFITQILIETVKQLHLFSA